MSGQSSTDRSNGGVSLLAQATDCWSFQASIHYHGACRDTGLAYESNHGVWKTKLAWLYTMPYIRYAFSMGTMLVLSYYLFNALPRRPPKVFFQNVSIGSAMLNRVQAKEKNTRSHKMDIIPHMQTRSPGPHAAFSAFQTLAVILQSLFELTAAGSGAP